VASDGSLQRINTPEVLRGGASNSAKSQRPKSLRVVDLERELGPLISLRQFRTLQLQSFEELVCGESKNPEAQSSEALE
jgi:hypothetical protein